MKVVWFYILMPICADRRANIILLIPPWAEKYWKFGHLPFYPANCCK